MFSPKTLSFGAHNCFTIWEARWLIWAPFWKWRVSALGEGLCEQWRKLSGGLISGLQWVEDKNYSLVDYFSPWNTWGMILAKANGSAGQFIICLLWMSSLNYPMDRFRLPHPLSVPASISSGFNARKNSHLNANFFSLLSPEVTKPPSNTEKEKASWKIKWKTLSSKTIVDAQPLWTSSGNTFSQGHSRQIYLRSRPLIDGKIYTVAFSSYLPAVLSDSKIKSMYLYAIYNYLYIPI